MQLSRKHWKAVAWGLFGAAALAAFIWALRPRPVRVEIGTATRGPYEQVVYEDGKTRATDIYTVASDFPGNLKRVRLHAGDWVNEGDVVAQVEWDHLRVITSPVSGRILRVIRESAGPIERGDPIMELANANALEVVADVLTTDAVEIKPGDIVRMEGWPGCEALRGRVRLVEPSAFTKVSALGIEEQRVNVIIDFTTMLELCEGLGDAYRVHCHIVTFSTDDALTIPTGALFRVGDAWAVFKVDGGRARRVVVEVERRNPERAMIKAGLTAGDRVVVYPSDAVGDGVRVVGF